MEPTRETLPTPERSPERQTSAEFGEINKGDIKEALQDLTAMEGSSEVFGDMSTLGDIGGSETPQTTHLLAICAAIWAKKQPGDKGSANKFLTSFRRWASDHGQTGLQIAEMLLRRLYAAQKTDYDRHTLSDADTLRDTIITTLGLTEHLGEADNERYEIALRAAVWCQVEAGEMLPDPAEIRQVFRDTIHLWHKGVEEYQMQQKTIEATYKSILQDL